MAAERDRLEHRVYHHLLHQVSSKSLEPGKFVRAGHLAKHLNVSRTTVRKALTRLVTDGWMVRTEAGYTSSQQSPQKSPSVPPSLEPVGDAGLDHRSQIEATYWLIFDWILQGTCRGGDNVLPRELAGRFSVSVGTVRHALDWLTQDGVLLRAPRRGWRYRSLTLPDVVDTIEIRTMFECEVLRRAGTRIPASVLRRLQAETADILDRFESLSEVERRRADYEFHTTLVEQSTSSVLIDVVKPLIRRSMYVGISCPSDKRHQPRSFREHMAILEALLAGTETAAIEVLQAHLRRALTDAIPALGATAPAPLNS
jgi:DNA-binding GntR family transcriptional regulator